MAEMDRLQLIARLPAESLHGEETLALLLRFALLIIIVLVSPMHLRAVL